MKSIVHLICLAVAVSLGQKASGLAPPAVPRSHRTIPARSQQLWSSKAPLENDGGRKDDSTDSASFKDKLAELDSAIASAEAERRKLLRAELDRYEKKDDSQKLEGTRNLVPVEEWTPRELRRPPPNTIQKMPPPTTRKSRPMSTRSKVTRSDAGTLVIEITPQGVTSGVLFNGAFSVAWFSAIIPATLAALSGGLVASLFLLPFWAAGGMVAKQAVVDPFVSNKLSIGQYAWSVESLYANNKIQKQEGSTEDLQGAKVEVPVVVNNVPQYQLSLYDLRKGVVSLGMGLPPEELEKVANDINEYLEALPSDEDNNEPRASWEQ